MNTIGLLRSWKTLLLSSLLLMALVGFGTFFDIMSGIGFFYIIVIAYFNALVVIGAIVRTQSFGAGLAVYLPGALLGLFLEYYMEMVVSPVLKSYWCVAAYSAFFLVSGLAADLAWRFLPRALSGQRRAIAAGVVLMLVHFGLMYAGSLFFYRAAPAPVVRPLLGEVSLSSILWWGLPWLFLNAGFGGYTAFALAGRGRSAGKETV